MMSEVVYINKVGCLTDLVYTVYAHKVTRFRLWQCICKISEHTGDFSVMRKELQAANCFFGFMTPLGHIFLLLWMEVIMEADCN